MARDRISADPDLARKTLVAGAVLHFMICLPLFGRRGFPEVDPFFLGAMWLWIPPVCISAMFSRFDRIRNLDLLWFSMAAGFVISWGTINLVPSRKSPLSAFVGLGLYAPLTLGMVAIVELLSRMILSRIRKFVASDQSCETCGYYLYGLVESRCRECGTAFDIELLSEGYRPATTGILRRRSTYFIALIAIAGMIWPFAFRHVAFESKRQTGRARAAADWQTGTPCWYISPEEMDAFSAEQHDAVIDAEFGMKPMSGWTVRRMWRDWEHLEFQRAYRVLIEEKLKAAGLQPPAF